LTAEERDERNAEIVRMIRAQIPTVEIAKEMHASKWTVYAIAREHGLELTKMPSRMEMMQDMEVDLIIEDYAARGLPIHEITLEHEISVETLYELLAARGIPLRRTTRSESVARMMQYDRAIEMYKEGWAYAFIQEEVGISQPSLNKELRKRNVPLRGRGHRGKHPLRKPDGSIYVDGVDEGTTPEPPIRPDDGSAV
jgi:hypothetical protein